MDKSLEMCKQAKLIQEKIENVNRPITSKGIESERHLGASMVEASDLAQVMIPGSWGIKSHIMLPARSLIFPLPIPLPLCVSHEYINKIFKKENRYKDVKGPK